MRRHTAAFDLQAAGPRAALEARSQMPRMPQGRPAHILGTHDRLGVPMPTQQKHAIPTVPRQRVLPVYLSIEEAAEVMSLRHKDDSPSIYWVTFHTFRRSVATLIDREVGRSSASPARSRGQRSRATTTCTRPRWHLISGCTWNSSVPRSDHLTPPEPHRRALRGSAPARQAVEPRRAQVYGQFVDSFGTRLKTRRASGLRFRRSGALLLAPPVGLEPTTLRLTAECSAS